MKRILVFLYLIPAFGMSQPVTDGLVGYWPLNGNANNEVGNSPDGIVFEAIPCVDRMGNTDHAYKFDGINDYINLGNASDLLLGGQNEPMTLSIWVNTKKTGGMNYGPIWLVNRYFVRIDSNPDLGVWGVEREFNIGLNTWTHIVMTWDGSVVISIINGTNISSSAPGTGIGSGSGNLILGNRAGKTEYFEGEIDEVMIFNRVLSHDEIQSIYNYQAPPTSVLCQNVYCDDGNVGIGTYETKGYKLAVAGKIIAEEVKVALQTNWPDHVFDEKYKLNNLTYLENYIKTNKHLPNIPNAEFVAKEGYNLGEMDSKLLEKIEELTLYLIEQNKRTELLIKEVELLKEENQELRELIDH